MKLFIQIPFVLLICFFKSVWSTTSHPWNEKFKVPGSTCTTDECFEHATFLTNIINTRLDPCKDFYEYVCSNWQKMHPNPLYYPEWSIDSEMGERSFYGLRAILEEPITNQDNDAIVKAKNFYTQCMNLPHLGLYDNTIIASYIRGASYFPMFHPLDSNSQKTSWTDVHDYYLGLTGESALFDITLRNPEAKNYETILQLGDLTSPYGLFLPKEQFSVAKLKVYEKFLATLLQRVIINKTQWKSYSLIEKDLMDVLSFRRELHAIKLEYFRTDKRQKFMTIHELDTWYHNMAKNYKSTSHISWVQLFRHLYRRTYTMERMKTVIINVQNKIYFRLLVRLLNKIPEHVIINHMHLYFIERHLVMGEHLKKMMMDVITDHGKLLGIIRYIGRRWHICIAINEVRDQLGLVYVNRYFPLMVKEKAEDLVNELKSMMEIIISDSTWLDTFTKAKSKRLITDMKATIGYPEYYDDFSQKIEFLERRIIEPGKIDAIYSPYSNRLSISAAFLTQPMFSTQLPAAVNYGAMGMNVAHEIYHAFGLDHMERQEIEYYWPQNMLQMYRDKAGCFVKQFDGLPVQELKDIKPVPRINGSSTVDENIADTMGLKLAYETFRKTLWTTRECETLPNLPGITCLKLFFISFAMSFCSVLTPDGMMEYVEKGIHSTPRLRVNGALSNMAEFARLFQCPEKSPMNPQNKCNLWT